MTLQYQVLSEFLQGDAGRGAALRMQPLADRRVGGSARLRRRKAGAKRGRSRRRVRNEVVRANWRRYGALRPGWTDGDDAVRRAVSPVLEHCAMMLAVATATGREASVRILSEREHRRNQGKREGREQQDGQQASHKRSDSSSVRLRSPVSARYPGSCSNSVKYGGVVV